MLGHSRKAVNGRKVPRSDILKFLFLGAFGYFEVTHDITKYCKAKVFEHIGKRTPIAIRFSTVGKALWSPYLTCVPWLR